MQVPTQAYSFLSALPALLGIAGFVLYQVVGSNKAGDEISRRIVDKLRRSVSGDAVPDKRLTPRQVAGLLEQQHRLKEVVGMHDFLLLQQALKQQFILTIIVYVLTLGFCGWSAYLFVQPPGAIAIPNTQSSSGINSPNINSSGSGPVTVHIQPKPEKTDSPDSNEKPK